MDFIEDVTNFIFISSEPQPSDVIFLPGGSDPALPERAAQLYHEGYAPLVVPSGKYGKELGHFKKPSRKAEIYGEDHATEADFYTAVLLYNGVPAEAILCDREAEFTYQNAEFSKKLLDSAGINVRRAILVCKAFHARRAYTYYKNAFPGANISVTPVEGRSVTADGWYKTDAGIRCVSGELRRMGEQFRSLAKCDEALKKTEEQLM